jgi:hypothetical protein
MDSSSPFSFRKGAKAMRKISIFLLLLVSMLVFMQAAPAAASEPVDVSGILTYIPYPVGEPKIAGGSTFFQTAEESWYVGGFVGTADDECTVIVHANGSWTYNAVSYFTGTVNGQAGEMTMRLNGRRPDASSEWTGEWVILGGSGELAGLHGQGIFYGVGSPGFGEPGEITYEGQIHFDPAD